MHSVDPILERMLRHLAHRLTYNLSDAEVNVYREQLTKYPIYLLADAVLQAENEYPVGAYPSLAWFRMWLGAKMEENNQRA